ncbi:hypothetical protein [Rhodoferax sp.]|uniref:hypothetical protein n=1 Tax=Rhodoferax sp. TaxID=50421 RepID=UPI002ACDF10B|nr:hypothetical protein [Rhodoferax sp.]MDZ7919476.1 hypothetical protein [Rhodoferax sp.]
MTLPTTDLALMAGAAYVSNRKLENRFPAPNGWKTTTYAEPTDGGSGFEAIAFIRTGTELKTSPEIVISYTGTNGDGDMPENLAIAAGKFSEQLMQAAQYYLDIKALAPKDANITFTGHNLDGGLAALGFVNQVLTPKDASARFGVGCIF